MYVDCNVKQPLPLTNKTRCRHTSALCREQSSGGLWRGGQKEPGPRGLGPNLPGMAVRAEE